MAYNSVSEDLLSEEAGLTESVEGLPRPRGKGRLAVALGSAAMVLMAGAAWTSQGPTSGDVDGIISAAGEACAHDGQSCRHSHCCQNPESKCFEKNEHWASCNATCSHKHYWDTDHSAWKVHEDHMWNCAVLDKPQCSHSHENCADTGCCKQAGFTCFKKNEYWSACNRTCEHNMAWNHEAAMWEKQDKRNWDCTVIAQGKNLVHSWENCKDSRRCKDENHACFKKDEHWAACNKSCAHNMNWENGQWVRTNKHHWDCEILSHQKCSRDHENCMHTGCCRDAHHACFKKNDHWANCNRSCHPKMDWEVDGWKLQEDKVWDCNVITENKCSAPHENCMHTKCCATRGQACFKKNEHWANCNHSCAHNMKWSDEANAWERQDEKVWDCTVL